MLLMNCSENSFENIVMACDWNINLMSNHELQKDFEEMNCKIINYEDSYSYKSGKNESKIDFFVVSNNLLKIVNATQSLLCQIIKHLPLKSRKLKKYLWGDCMFQREKLQSWSQIKHWAHVRPYTTSLKIILASKMTYQIRNGQYLSEISLIKVSWQRFLKIRIMTLVQLVGIWIIDGKTSGKKYKTSVSLTTRKKLIIKYGKS